MLVQYAPMIYFPFNLFCGRHCWLRHQARPVQNASLRINRMFHFPQPLMSLALVLAMPSKACTEWARASTQTQINAAGAVPPITRLRATLHRATANTDFDATIKQRNHGRT